MDKNNIETIVPLLPMQTGFLWHSLKPATDSQTLQLRCTLEGKIDVERLKNAWQTVVNRHQALRSSVHWKNTSTPVQVIMKSITPDWHFINLRSVHDQQGALDAYLNQDKQDGIDLSKAPGYRVALFQLSPARYEFIWSLSHVMLDGWSCALVLNDWVRSYSQTADHDFRPPALALHDQIRWIKEQDDSALSLFWQQYLPDEPSVAALPFRHENLSGDQQRQSVQALLDTDNFARLQSEILRRGLTLGVVLQALWSVLLRADKDTPHAIFGATLSGRQIDLSHASDRVGMLINLVPVVVKFNDSDSVSSWLKQLQENFFSLLPFAHASMQQIQAYSGQNKRLFESLLVVENQPTVVSTNDISVTGFKSGIQSDFELTVVAIPGDDLSIEFIYNVNHFEQHHINQLASGFIELLMLLPDSMDKTVIKICDHNPHFGRKSYQENTVATPQSASSIKSTLTGETNQKVFSALEHQLIDIWSNVLEISALSLEADFFELGGTSLQAVMLFEQIEEKLNIALPPTALFGASTISGLVNVINQNNPDSHWSTTVEIQPHGDLPPLFIPINSAHMLMYRNLAQQMGPRQPIVGFRSTDSALPIEELADTLIEHMIKLQPTGPYFIAGMSGAGALAWVMAQKLKQQNRTVAMLALLDSYGPNYPELKPPLSRLLSMSGFFAREFSGFVIAYANRFIKGRKTDQTTSQTTQPSQIRSDMHENLAYQQQLDQEIAVAKSFVREVSKSKPLIERYINWFILNLTSIRFHSFNMRIGFIVFTQGLLIEFNRLRSASQGNTSNSPSGPTIESMQVRFDSMYGAITPYSDKIIYLRCEQRPPGVTDDFMSGWQGLAGDNMQIEPVPGNHGTLLKQPNVAILADVLTREMEKMRQNSESAVKSAAV